MAGRGAIVVAMLALACCAAAQAQRPSGCAALAANGVPAAVSRVLAEVLRVPPAAMRPEARIAEDLRADELSEVEIVMAIRRDLGVELDDAWARQARTVGALNDLVVAALRPRCQR
ncbi:acyl carrier protein [Falsiroseomonas sp. HW251]|uniref:acyl carrier protein n=1 Tax=Falsiroseomonas sp. HW251 TaxID=3390998 RepID=UPI003D3191F2